MAASAAVHPSYTARLLHYTCAANTPPDTAWYYISVDSGIHSITFYFVELLSFLLPELVGLTFTGPVLVKTGGQAHCWHPLLCVRSASLDGPGRTYIPGAGLVRTAQRPGALLSQEKAVPTNEGHAESVNLLNC